MNCRQIQEIIITDYIDAQLGDRQKSLIDGHLAQCQACQDFLTDLKKDAVIPFRSARLADADAMLWGRIKSAIEQEQEEQQSLVYMPNFWQRFVSAVQVPRPGFAIVTIVTVLFMVSSTSQIFMSGQLVKTGGQDQVEYLSSLVNEPVDTSEVPTPIEKYFL